MSGVKSLEFVLQLKNYRFVNVQFFRKIVSSGKFFIFTKKFRNPDEKNQRCNFFTPFSVDHSKWLPGQKSDTGNQFIRNVQPTKQS